MKLLFSILFVSMVLFSPSLSKVRKDYVNAVNNKEATVELNRELAEIDKSDDKILVAYKGAVLTLMAKFAKTTKERKSFFKEGVLLIDYAVSEKPKNVEIRCVRLGVQENSPKITGYRKNKEEDKNFILTHYKEIASKDVKSFVKGFVMQSKMFSEEEKMLVN